jgi:hypothetical protein
MDGSPGIALPVTNEADPYDGTDNDPSQGWQEKRTLQLVKDDVVWDLAGNLWEYVYETKDQLGLDEANFSDQELSMLSKRNRELFGPFNPIHQRPQNMGAFRAWPNSLILRGGGSRGGYAGLGDGLFSAIVGEHSLNYNSPQEPWGFRCVARPSR